MSGKRYDVVAAGLQCIDIITSPIPGAIFDRQITTIDSVQIGMGGDALNQAVTLSKLGSRTVLMGASGSDQFADVLLGMLAKYDLTVINGKTDVNTAVSIVLLDGSGERHFVCQLGNNDAFCYAHMDEDVLRNTSILSIGGCMYLPKLDGEGTIRALELTKSSGGQTCVDFRIDPDNYDLNVAREVIRRADYILPSEQEAFMLTGEKDDPKRMVECLRDMGARNCIVKLGELGCYVAADGYEGIIPTYPCRCIDTTGAGDTFVGAFLHAKVKGWDIERCARFANAAGSIAVEYSGANGAIQSEQCVLDRMNGVR